MQFQEVPGSSVAYETCHNEEAEARKESVD